MIPALPKPLQQNTWITDGLQGPAILAAPLQQFGQKAMILSNKQSKGKLSLLTKR